MKTDNTTPRPWAITGTTPKGYGSEWREIVSTGAEFSPAFTGLAQKDDAELIVRAVNAHDNLVAFASLVANLETSDAMGERHDSDDSAATLDELIFAARAALAKAKGK